MLVRVQNDEIEFGDLCTVGFERTLRVPADGKNYAVPPGLGAFQIHDLSQFGRVPAAWKDRSTLVIALAPCEALWVCFSARWWHPCAVRLTVEGTNVMTGRRLTKTLGTSQDYLPCPAQPWLAAYSPRPGELAQFLPPPIRGAKRTVAPPSQSLDLQILVHAPRPGRFEENPPESVRDPFVMGRPCELRLGPGEGVRHRVCPDPHGREVWEAAAAADVHIRLVSSATFIALTGAAPPPTPIGRHDYEAFGVPWLEEYEDYAA